MLYISIRMFFQPLFTILAHLLQEKTNIVDIEVQRTFGPCLLQFSYVDMCVTGAAFGTAAWNRGACTEWREGRSWLLRCQHIVVIHLAFYFQVMTNVS